MLKQTTGTKRLSRFISDYGMLGVLILLCLFFSILTVDAQHPTGEKAAKSLVKALQEGKTIRGGVVIVARASDEELAFAQALERELTAAGVASVTRIIGDPATVRAQLTGLSKARNPAWMPGGFPGLFGKTWR